MNTKKTLLLIGAVLVLIGFLKPDLSNILPNPRPVTVDVMELAEPTDAVLKKEADEVVVLLQKLNAKSDIAKFRKLRDLYLDLARLVELDGEDTVIKTTDEIRQANSISGVMLRLDMKDKYADLKKELNDVMVSGIGDDSLNVSSELRTKGIDSFLALAWAINEGVK